MLTAIPGLAVVVVGGAVGVVVIGGAVVVVVVGGAVVVVVVGGALVVAVMGGVGMSSGVVFIGVVTDGDTGSSGVVVRITAIVVGSSGVVVRITAVVVGSSGVVVTITAVVVGSSGVVVADVVVTVVVVVGHGLFISEMVKYKVIPYRRVKRVLQPGHRSTLLSIYEQFFCDVNTSLSSTWRSGKNFIENDNMCLSMHYAKHNLFSFL